jgi:hypothetical protein
VRLGAAFAALLAPGLLAAGAGHAAPTPVATGPHDENRVTAGWSKSGTREYVAFTRRILRTDRRNALLRIVRPNGAFTRIRLNVGRDADVGGFFHRRRVLYVETRRGSSDLRVYDIPTGRRWVPPGVNTTKHEWLPTRSGRYLLFNRDDRGGPGTRVVLRDVATRVETVLDRSAVFDSWVYAGQVSGRWAVWTRCADTCDVYKRDLASGVTTVVPKPGGGPGVRQYDGSVTADGTVYAARHAGSGACESVIELVRFAADDPPEGTVIARLGPDRFTTLTYARPNPGGSVDLFFPRASCSTFTHDAVKVRVPPP